MENSEHYYAAAAMLIRQPVAIVFDAFIDPGVTSKIWFTKSSGRLEEGIQLNLAGDRFPKGLH